MRKFALQARPTGPSRQIAETALRQCTVAFRGKMYVIAAGLEYTRAAVRTLEFPAVLQIGLRSSAAKRRRRDLT